MSFRTNALKIVPLALIAAFFLASCQTAEKKEPEQKILSYSEEMNLSSKLTANLEKKYGAWKEPRLEKALGNILKALIAANELGQKVEGAHVTLLATDEVLIAPGFLNKIYVSRGLLLMTKYENELSYVLAQQLAYLKNDEVRKSYLTLQGQSFGQALVTLPTAVAVTPDPLASKWFNKGGLFDFGEETFVVAEKDAIKMIYQSRFDARGATAFVLMAPKMKSMLAIWPDSAEQLERVRGEVAKLTPIRNAIVKTGNFEEISTALKKAKK